LDAERQAHDARGMAAQVARGLAVLVERRRNADAHVARAEDGRDLPAFLHERRARARDFVEVEAIGVKNAASLEVFDREMKRVVPQDPQGFALHASSPSTAATAI